MKITLSGNPGDIFEIVFPDGSTNRYTIPILYMKWNEAQHSPKIQEIADKNWWDRSFTEEVVKMLLGDRKVLAIKTIKDHCNIALKPARGLADQIKEEFRI